MVLEENQSLSTGSGLFDRRCGLKDAKFASQNKGKNGGTDKKLDREGARMYTYEERMRAVKAYIASGSGYQANKTIQEPGYPSHEALRRWNREYRKNGDLHRDFIRTPPHTREQKEKAVAHYYANGCNYTKTSKALGYVSRDRMRQWVLETRQSEGSSCRTRRNVVKCTPEQKREFVVGFCARGGQYGKDRKPVWSESFQPIFLSGETVCRGVYRRDAKIRGANHQGGVSGIAGGDAALVERAEALRREDHELERIRRRRQRASIQIIQAIWKRSW